MTVDLYHDGRTITSVEPAMERWPWTTCPGAEAVLRETFTGVELWAAARRGGKTANCTHLYDLAVFAAAHASDTASTIYDMAVSDPVDGEIIAELSRNGKPMLRWVLRDDRLQEPPFLAGKHLRELREWIATLPADEREAARILQWGGILAHGRAMALDFLSDPAGRPPSCYTYQPENAAGTVRIGEIIDFSRAARQPLADPGEAQHSKRV
ncbi:MAG: DUF2889 domain-containing protein [Novosphingobium sp.]|nr:DUF2889 domain-containing protein [Novosphingobium sp.]